MDWLTQLSAGQVAQGGAALAIVISAIFYVVKFQSTFTDRLESQGKKDEERIEDLGRKLDEERRARRAAEDLASDRVDAEVRARRDAESYAARLAYMLRELGTEPPPAPGTPSPTTDQEADDHAG